MTNVECRRLLAKNAEYFAKCDKRHPPRARSCGLSTSTEEAAFTSISHETSNQPTASFFEDPLRIRTILVPIDLSEESCRALEFAVPLAQRFGAVVHIVHVYEGASQLSSISTAPVL
jgi:Universal stress protein family